jgi:hypothetical protein
VQTFSEIAIRRDKFDFGASFTPADNHLAGNGANPIQQLEIDRAAAFAIPDTTTSCSSRRGRGTTRPCNNPGPGETSLANFAGQPIPARIGGTGDHRRGERAAAIYTLIGTAKLRPGSRTCCGASPITPSNASTNFSPGTGKSPLLRP